jgi:ferrochelatase
MSTAERKLLVLVNLGTPSVPTAEAVRDFLLEFLSDPGVIDLPRWLWQPILRGAILGSRPRRIAELYRSIWLEGGSPLEVGTRKIVDGVAGIAGGGVEVAWAYRYGEPSLGRILAERTDADAEVAILPLYAHRTSSTTESVFIEADRVAARLGMADRVHRVELAADDPGFIEALADRCRSAFAEGEAGPEHLLLSYHGIPSRYDRREGRRYSADCRATTDALLAALDWDAGRATHCYQSKFGPERWLGPATADLIERLPKQGIRRLAVVTPAFLTEGLETIEEIGMRGREAFEKAGGETFIRVPATEDHPLILDALLRAALRPPTRRS